MRTELLRFAFIIIAIFSISSVLFRRWPYVIGLIIHFEVEMLWRARPAGQGSIIAAVKQLLRGIRIGDRK